MLTTEQIAEAAQGQFGYVSVSCTVGPEGANFEGWITYASCKIHFAKKKVAFSAGVFAGGGAAPSVPVADPDVIAGKVGTFLIEGAGFGASGGAVNLYLDGKHVVGPIPIAGTGVGHFKAEGEVQFSNKQ